MSAAWKYIPIPGMMAWKEITIMLKKTSLRG